jgi:site-specific DNA-methyltransferase (adenine-specific)
MLIRLKFSLDQLVNSILDQLPEEVVIHGTFLDPAIGGGQFLKEVERRKRLAGKTAEEIKQTVFGLEENILRRDFAVNKYKLTGTYKVGNIFGMEETMKFDVVLGNPPYQDPNNDKRMLWNQIIDKAVEVTKDGGYIAMVNPTTWLTAKTNIHNSYKMFETKQVERAVIYDKNDKPFDEGTSVSYTITKNVKRVYPTPLFYGQYSTNTETHVADINIAKDKIWPGQLSSINIAIHNKLQAYKKIKFLKSCEFHNQKLKKKKMVSDVKDSIFQYTHHVSAAITRYTNTKFSNHVTWKVMVPLTSTIDRAVVDNNCGHGEDMLSLYVTDQKVANNIKALFNTRFYKFIGMLYKNGRNQPLQNLFPILDFTKVWTDSELYAHFGLTQEEIDYIEANVK